MQDVTPRLLEVFFDVHRGLPRQGVGDSQSTSKALTLCSELPRKPTVLDIGCGSGMQTIVLAESCSGSIITAVDNCDEYLDTLRRRVQEASLSDRVEIKNTDMTALDFSEETFDLIWCEGAIYNMGVAKALKNWRPLLRDHGCVAFSELVWLVGQPIGEVADFFANEYPAMTNIESVKEAIRECGYQLLGDFTLPESAWWDDYYTPLEAKFASLKQKYRGDDEALGVIAMSEAEIDIRRRFAHFYGYHFFVIGKVD